MARRPARHTSSGPGTQEAPGHCSLTKRREDTGGLAAAARARARGTALE